MRTLIVALTLVMASLISVPLVSARDANRDALQRMWHEQQMDQKRWEAVIHSTGTARQEALQNYIYNMPWLWEPVGN